MKPGSVKIWENSPENIREYTRRGYFLVYAKRDLRTLYNRLTIQKVGRRRIHHNRKILAIMSNRRP